MSPPVRLERRGAAAWITIDRPQVLNAMDSHAHLALSEHLDAVQADPGARVIVLTGAGDRAFSVGRDLKEMAAAQTGTEEAGAALDARWARVRRLTDRHELTIPVIARVHGLALGGGFELALACDIIVASTASVFALPEVRRGLIPSAGGVHRLPRQIPLKVAMGHLLTGRPMSAARAEALGLVNEVVPQDQLDAAVAAWVADILAGAPLALRAIKQCVAQGDGRTLAEAMAATYPAEALLQASQDSREGPAAFAEGRLPVWAGR